MGFMVFVMEADGNFHLHPCGPQPQHQAGLTVRLGGCVRE